MDTNDHLKETLEYAQDLARRIWEEHWKDDAPSWKPLNDIVGVLSQIDNMVAGMTRHESPITSRNTSYDAMTDMAGH